MAIIKLKLNAGNHGDRRFKMQYTKIFGMAALVIVTGLMLLTASCFGSGSIAGGSTATPTPVKPQPKIESVVATTSGTESSYFATLDIKVKNNGADGTILVQASVTQAGITNQNKMPVYLKQGEDHELKMTFPLVWQGGDFTPNVQAVVP